jgi:hypothetical protein
MKIDSHSLIEVMLVECCHETQQGQLGPSLARNNLHSSSRDFNLHKDPGTPVASTDSVC